MELSKWLQGCRVWHPPFVLSLAPAQVEQADTLLWTVPCSLASLSAPLSIYLPHGAIEESEHGQCSASLHVGQAGVGWAVLWPQSSLSAAGMLFQQAPVLVQLCGEENEGRRRPKTGVDRALLASCVCLLWPQLLTTEATAAMCVKYGRKCWVFPSVSPKLCQARGLPDKAASSSLRPCPAYLRGRLSVVMVGHSGLTARLC